MTRVLVKLLIAKKTKKNKQKKKTWNKLPRIPFFLVTALKYLPDSAARWRSNRFPEDPGLIPLIVFLPQGENPHGKVRNPVRCRLSASFSPLSTKWMSSEAPFPPAATTRKLRRRKTIRVILQIDRAQKWVCKTNTKQFVSFLAFCTHTNPNLISHCATSLCDAKHPSNSA